MSALLRDLEENPVECCSVKTRSKDMTKWKVLVRGPDGTPYEGGVFKLAIDIPDEFPYAPPDVVNIPAYPILSTRLVHIPVFHDFLSFLSFYMIWPSILFRVFTMSMYLRCSTGEGACNSFLKTGILDGTFVRRLRSLFKYLSSLIWKWCLKSTILQHSLRLPPQHLTLRNFVETSVKCCTRNVYGRI